MEVIPTQLKNILNREVKKVSQKSYNNTPTLYLIPTPIGNMEDITLRAINKLKEVEVIFSEDTRVTSMLLNHLEIKKKLISNHLYNEEKNKEKALEYLKKGFNIGLVTDRGTPIISDPGYELVSFIIKQNYNVVALPGPTALIPALITSGICPQPFLFFGFLNSNESKRKKELDLLTNEKSTLIFYEAPHRITKTLENIYQIFGNRIIAVAREISKKFEEIYRGPVEEVIKQVADIKGEIVIVVSGNEKENTYENLNIIDHVNLYIKEGKEVKEAIKLVAKDRKVSKSIVYHEYHQIRSW